jgi:hypothetical protein
MSRLVDRLVSRFGLVTAIAIGALVAALQAAPSQAAHKRAVQSRAYDGLWSVSIYTSYGPCATYRYPARIVGGRVVQAVNDFSYQISGAVAASGATAVTLVSGGQYAVGYGRLRGASGAGRWSAGGNLCSGTWSAIRRTAAAN